MANSSGAWKCKTQLPTGSKENQDVFTLNGKRHQVNDTAQHELDEKKSLCWLRQWSTREDLQTISSKWVACGASWRNAHSAGIQLLSVPCKFCKVENIHARLLGIDLNETRCLHGCVMQSRPGKALIHLLILANFLSVCIRSCVCSVLLVKCVSAK